MLLYATKFREKGEKEYKTVFIMAKDYNDYKEKFQEFLKQDGEYYKDMIDKRTISWAGGSVPFMSLNRPEVIHCNIDEVN